MPTRHADPNADCEARRPPIELMLRNLPAQHREIIVATYFRRRTTREAARRLGLTPPAASARLYQAMASLSHLIAARPDIHRFPYTN
jgi:DNA-directed RNA polymerase specialized sigma24 family protein